MSQKRDIFIKSIVWVLHSRLFFKVLSMNVRATFVREAADGLGSEVDLQIVQLFYQFAALR